MHEAQLPLLASEAGRDDQIDVVVCDRFGRVIDVIPAHLGNRLEVRDRCSLHEAVLWAHLAVAQAAECLPPPTWATVPVHDPPAASATFLTAPVGGSHLG